MDIFGEGTSVQTKIIGALCILFLFFVFVIIITWDRYGKEVSALYEASLETTQRPADADDDEFKAYKSLPTFFYEYAKKKK
ncbi:hypothetical protein Ae201684P_009695 [Aphanomyces euteiches]|uniref:Uncharacterized protein n=1 Tax=Aphanomyces euteiches TaxID=100861 RepID=A0A6G0XGS8_9STRA|nr:hypothetical protein Ae201684_004962 [Aphanomyces euteiches]KAH9082369.1 hypothetical protein Ae201684P_009695 [Aphanomyces euteiches]KAH9155313.1 hypothetical protein AeRB84_002708 [Aphanomyces euteiches]